MGSKAENSFYYEQLNREEKQVYHAMRSGLSGLAASFPVLRLPMERLSDIFFLLRLDHPELFFAGSFKGRFYPGADYMELIPEYLFPKKQLEEHRRAMEARVSKLVRPAEQLSETEKELYIHDFICGNVHYDKLKKAYSHEIIGPLGQGVGVCEGIAKTVKLLCDALGIWCIIALSDSNPEKGIKYRHTWNILRIGGQYYHLDATFDNSLGSPEHIRYDYYNIGDKQLWKDHERLLFPVPACPDHGHFYYLEKKLSFTKEEDIAKRAVQAARKGLPFSFHWRGGFLNRRLVLRFCELLQEAARAKGKAARISLNWPQAVFTVSYSPADQEEELVLEEANEGEEAFDRRKTAEELPEREDEHES